jgi:hypothetical protein
MEQNYDAHPEYKMELIFHSYDKLIQVMKLINKFNEREQKKLDNKIMRQKLAKELLQQGLQRDDILLIIKSNYMTNGYETGYY